MELAPRPAGRFVERRLALCAIVLGALTATLLVLAALVHAPPEPLRVEQVWLLEGDWDAVCVAPGGPQLDGWTATRDGSEIVVTPGRGTTHPIVVRLREALGVSTSAPVRLRRAPAVASVQRPDGLWQSWASTRVLLNRSPNWGDRLLRERAETRRELAFLERDLGRFRRALRDRATDEEYLQEAQYRARQMEAALRSLAALDGG